VVQCVKHVIDSWSGQTGKLNSTYRLSSPKLR